MKKRDKYFTIVSAIVVLIILFLLSRIVFFHKKEIVVNATSSTFSLSTEDNWNAGTLTNIDSATSSGSIKIANKGSSTLDLADKTITADYDVVDQANVVDGNTATIWGSNSATPIDYYWQVDLASSLNIGEIKIYTGLSDWYYKLQYSTNGTDFLDYSAFFNHSGPSSWDTYTVAVTARYIRIVCSRYITGEMAPPGVLIGELEIYSNASATHTTAPTQIDGGANFWEWTSFTPTQTVPPGTTSVTYRYRTTPNSDNTGWTPWVADIASVTSRSGDTKYRYLQVEATLSNTDGASTPTIDSYDIGYHTEVKPTKPVAQTAVTQ